MIDVARVQEILRKRYPSLEQIGEGVFRGVDRHAEREYAVRYFDLNDEVIKIAPSIKKYQEERLADRYFSKDTDTDLRWNQYLYFITSGKQSDKSEFKLAKITVESDREYARKIVVDERNLAELLTPNVIQQSSLSLPKDLATTWMEALNRSGLGFVLDDQVSAPEVIRRISLGQKDELAKTAPLVTITSGEKAAVKSFISRLTISGFRSHPTLKEHEFGLVNLIVGSNGAGKTSLLEAIEYLYCGSNRRFSTALPNTSLSATLKGTTEKLSSTTEPGPLRARNLQWYSRTDLKAVTVKDSFGKFNFLDTDAAVKLTVATSSEQLSEDVKRLVLGAEAEKVADRIRRVSEKLHEGITAIEHELESAATALAEAAQRIDAIKNTPRLSDTLFSELLSTLDRLGWREPPQNASLAEAFREQLQATMGSINLIQETDREVLGTNVEALKVSIESLDNAVNHAAILEQRRERSARLLLEAKRQGDSSTIQLGALDRLILYVKADFAQLLAEIGELEKEAIARMRRLSRYVPPLLVSDMAEFLSLELQQALGMVSSKIDDLRKKQSNALEARRVFESTQSEIALLYQQVRSSAKELLKHIDNSNQCPVCQTTFESGELLARLQLDFSNNSSAQLENYRIITFSLEKDLTTYQALAITLQSLIELFSDATEPISVSEALARLQEEADAAQSQSSRLSVAKEQLRGMQTSGLSKEGLAEALRSARLAVLPSESVVILQREEVLGVAETNRNAVATHESELAEIQRECEVLAADFSVNLPVTPTTLVEGLRVRLSNLRVATDGKATLDARIRLAERTTAMTLLSGLSIAQDLAMRVITSQAQEAASNSALAHESANLEKLKARAEEHKVILDRRSCAQNLLLDLMKESSGAVIADKILMENAEAIGRSFSNIHVPNEFDLRVENGKLRIRRTRIDKDVQIDEMSTGQRAAYALSLFLAMNGRLRTGPPVMLFDDPVAHVDDINILSFLDYLRELAISGARQIFFATADVKLAGLFRHKFRFLGQDFHEVRLSWE